MRIIYHVNISHLEEEMKKNKKTTGKTPRKTASEKKYESLIEKFKGKNPYVIRCPVHSKRTI